MSDGSYPVEEIGFVDKDIDKEHQISFTLHDNIKAADKTSAYYSFACSVDFTRDPVDEIKMREESYPAGEIDFVEKDIDK